MTEAGVEHQNSTRHCVRGKYSEHRPLIVVPEMKEAVPG
jgi:hypothetical protein